MTTYGIDLGTTYSCIAHTDGETGRPVVVKNLVGDDTTPSVVYFESPETVVVGQAAKDTALLHPELVVSLIKRQMGKELRLQFHGREHTPETISALILQHLAESVERQGGAPVTDVVITVPAYFGVAEREATRNAGTIAGLNVLNVVPEPVAAALHYQQLGGAGERTILVYDLGGGTFDTTVIRISGKDVRVVCTDGDHELGGVDWDRRLTEYLLGEFSSDHPGADAAADESFQQELAGLAEQRKKDLSSVQTRKQPLRYDGATVTVELTRQGFEELTAELLERTLHITQRTVDKARQLGVERFDAVLLVGGATRMPAVAAGLRDRFGFEPQLHDPDLAVAKGAALFAVIESVKIRLPDAGGADPTVSPEAVREVATALGLSEERVRDLADTRVTTVVPRAFGVKLVRNHDHSQAYVFHLLEANTSLPADSGPQRIVTVHEGQTALHIEVWEQAGAVASEDLADNTKIGEGQLTGLPARPKGSPSDVTYAMDEMGTLRVHALELTTGRDLNIELVIGGMTPRDVAAARGALSSYEVSA